MFYQALSVILLLLIQVSSFAANPTTFNHPVRQFGLGQLACCAYSPDGNTVATGGTHGIYVWNARTGAIVQRIRERTKQVNALAYSPDGKMLLSANSDRSIRLWDIHSGLLMRAYAGHTAAVNAVAFSPSGDRFVSGGEDGKAFIWNTATGAIVWTLENSAFPVTGVDFSNTGIGSRVVTGRAGSYYAPTAVNNISFWNAQSGARIKSIAGMSADPVDVHYLPDDTGVLALFGTRGLGIIDTTNYAFTSYASGMDKISCDISRDGRLISFAGAGGGGDGYSEVIERSTKKTVASFYKGGPGFSGSIHLQSLFSPDSKRVLTIDESQQAEIWPIDTPTTGILRLIGHLSGIESVDLSPDDRQLIVGIRNNNSDWDGRANLYSMASGKRLRTHVFIDAHPDIWAAFNAAGNQYALIWQATYISFYNALTGGQIGGSLNSHGPFAAFSRNGAWWASGNHLYGAVNHTFNVDGQCGAFSADSRKIVLGDLASAAIFDLSAFARLATLTGHTGTINSVAFSPDGSRALTGADDGTLRVWNAATGAQLRAIQADAGAVNAVGWSPSGLYVISGGNDGNAKLWNPATGELMIVLDDHTAAINSLDINSNGSTVVLGSQDGSVSAWQVPTRNAVYHWTCYR